MQKLSTISEILLYSVDYRYDTSEFDEDYLDDEIIPDDYGYEI